MEYIETYTIEGNEISFTFNALSSVSDWPSSEFNYQRKSFEFSPEIAWILYFSEFEVMSSPLVFDLVKDTLKKRVLLEIVGKVRERAQAESLDSIQQLRINGMDCYLIDGSSTIWLRQKPSDAM